MGQLRWNFFGTSTHSLPIVMEAGDHRPKIFLSDDTPEDFAFNYEARLNGRGVTNGRDRDQASLTVREPEAESFRLAQAKAFAGFHVQRF